MKYHGRITIFGEYLNNYTSTLSLPSRFYISDDANELLGTNNYLPEKDKVRADFKNKGMSVKKMLYSNFIHDAGISSSSALAILHGLENTDNFDELKEIVNSSDKIMHGFNPSGLDFYSVYYSKPGLYHNGVWNEVEVKPFYNLFIEVPKEGKRTLAEIKKVMLSSNDKLVQLANDLSVKINTSSKIDFDLLWSYCTALDKQNVYSKAANKIVGELLAKKIAAKCLGGLYDKVILIASNNEKDIKMARELALLYKFKVHENPILFKNHT
jgi:mevalonate kinase